jgi:hypothetical protein
VGDPMGTRYPRGWRVWGDLRPDRGGGCGWRVIFTMVGAGVSCAPHRIFHPLSSLITNHQPNEHAAVKTCCRREGSSAADGGLPHIGGGDRREGVADDGPWSATSSGEQGSRLPLDFTNRELSLAVTVVLMGFGRQPLCARAPAKAAVC